MVGDSKCVHPSASTCIRMANICIDWPSLIHCNLFAEIELGSHGRHNGRLGNQRLKYGSNGVRLTHCSRPTQEVKQTMASMCLGAAAKGSRFRMTITACLATKTPAGETRSVVCWCSIDPANHKFNGWIRPRQRWPRALAACR